jgi:hypothetical protein
LAGRYLARGTAAAAYEAGQKERGIPEAIAAYASAAYQEAQGAGRWRGA